jgi:hypothetical protein
MSQPPSQPASSRASRAQARQERADQKEDNDSEDSLDDEKDANEPVEAEAKGLKFTARLDGISSWEYFIDSLQDHCFGKGQKYEDIVTQGLEGEPANDPPMNVPGYKTPPRRYLWATITAALAPHDRKKVKSIRRGDVEKLIRALKKIYDNKTETALDHDRSSLQTKKLHNFPDLDSYFTFHETTHKRIADHGDEEQLSEKLKRFHLFKGLPAEYEKPIASLKLPGSNYTWIEIKDYLRNFVE